VKRCFARTGVGSTPRQRMPKGFPTSRLKLVQPCCKSENLSKDIRSNPNSSGSAYETWLSRSYSPTVRAGFPWTRLHLESSSLALGLNRVRASNWTARQSSTGEDSGGVAALNPGFFHREVAHQVEVAVSIHINQLEMHWCSSGPHSSISHRSPIDCDSIQTRSGQNGHRHATASSSFTASKTGLTVEAHIALLGELAGRAVGPWAPGAT